MANIFDVTNERNNNVPQNTFDWSHQSNITGRLGFIYPFFCDLVPAKTTFRTTPKLGLQFMPMVFPVQTRMKARVSFFRMPLRSLWKDYKDYVGNFRTGLVEPYLDLATSFEKFMGTGKLADYLDIPTVLYGKYGSYTRADVQVDSSNQMPLTVFLTGGTSSTLAIGSNAYFNINASTPPPGLSTCQAAYITYPVAFNSKLEGGETYTVSSVDLPSSLTLNFLKGGFLLNKSFRVSLTLVALDSGNQICWTAGLCNEFTMASQTTDDYEVLNIPLSTKLSEFKSFVAPSSAVEYRFCVSLIPVDASTAWDDNYEYLYADFQGTVVPEEFSLTFGSDVRQAGIATEITRENSPYYDSTALRKDEQIRLKAYAPRAYEAIYNAYMRDNRNNPYYRNGQVEYNVWIPTDEGGADTYPYELHRANWEKDFLTTAVPSPQQGKAPLVGLTTYATTEDVDGITKTALKMALVDEDGKRYALKFSSSDDGVDGVEYAELSDGVSPQSLSYRSLVDAASTGISIPDLRMVNAYQKFLELNMRKGYSYKEIIEGRFDCQVRYDDLNMPEFIGGFTRDVNMNRVVQSVERNATEEYPEGSYANALGSLAGDAFLAAEGTQISCFCDEESIVMGVISVVPVPCYSQLLPKHYLYSDLLDHFQPEFDNIGFQPITYKEVCPIQAFNSGDDLNSTFGYQRPWYEYVQKTDKVHGLFRTQLRNFLMNRVFDVKPELTKSFLLVDDEQLNDVFAVTDTTDKFMGQIWLDCSVQLPISRVSIPRLD